MRHVPFLLLPLLLVQPIARADEAQPDADSTDSNPYAADPPPAPEAAEPAPEEPEPSRPSRRENRIKDHAMGLGYYYTHMQWNVRDSGATPQVDYHSMAVRYAYYVGQAQRFGFMINAAAIIPFRATQSGVLDYPETNRTYNLLSTYDRHVGFDVNLMAGTHRMLTDQLAVIAGLGLHVGILKLNDDELAIHEYITVGTAGVFSLRYLVTKAFTIGTDVNVSFDFRDTIDHRDPLDYAFNLGLTATMGLTF